MRQDEPDSVPVKRLRRIGAISLAGGLPPSHARAIDWDHLHRHLDWLGHILEGLVIAGLCALLARLLFRPPSAALVGLAFAAGHFHGREKRDFEVSVDMPPPHFGGYRIWRWNWDQATDFWPTLAVLLVVAVVIERRFRARRKMDPDGR